ncbi:MAG TPA: HIT domain-containing protein [Bacillota bacterium]
MSDCLFCKIAGREIPSQIVLETPEVLIFKDIHPAAPLHLLAIPKKHVDNICDPSLLDQDILRNIAAAIQETAAKLNLKENGFRVVVNYGHDAGEAVPHLHFHILAGRQLGWPPG